MTKPKKIKKSTVKSVPKSIRQSVRTILKAATDKNDGINLAGVVYFGPDGIGVAVSGSETFDDLLIRAANDYGELRNKLHETYQVGFQDGQDSVFHPNPTSH